MGGAAAVPGPAWLGGRGCLLELELLHPRLHYRPHPCPPAPFIWMQRQRWAAARVSTIPGLPGSAYAVETHVLMFIPRLHMSTWKTGFAAKH